MLIEQRAIEVPEDADIVAFVKAGGRIKSAASAVRISLQSFATVTSKRTPTERWRKPPSLRFESISVISSGPSANDLTFKI